MVELLLFSVPGLPALMAALLAFGPCRRPVVLATPLAALPALAAAVAAPAGALYEEPWLMLGARVGLDAAGQAFLGFCGALWMLAAATAFLTMRDDPNRTRFFACFLLAMAGNLGVFVAADVFTFYALFATMSFAAYGLVAHRADTAALAAGRLYIGFVLFGELALFAGLALAAAAVGSTALVDIRGGPLPDAAVALLIVGFSVKLGLMPAHLWLPSAHAEAPIAASAVLSGAMVKAGLFGLTAFLPLGIVEIPQLGAALVAAGLASIVLSPLLGAVRGSPKVVLAFSTIAQIGLAAVAVGIGLAHPEAWPAIAPALVLFAANHALAKGALFLGVGVVDAARSPFERRLAIATLFVPASALAALPLTAGYLAKSAFAEGFERAPDAWAEIVLPALAVGSVGTALLMARFFMLLLQRPAPSTATPAAVALPWFALVGLVAAAGGLLASAPSAPAPGGSGSILAAPTPTAVGLAIAFAAVATLRAAGLELTPGATKPQPTFRRREPVETDAGRRSDRRASFRLRPVLRLLSQLESEALGWRTILLVVCLVGLLSSTGMATRQ